MVCLVKCICQYLCLLNRIITEYLWDTILDYQCEIFSLRQNRHPIPSKPLWRLEIITVSIVLRQLSTLSRTLTRRTMAHAWLPGHGELTRLSTSLALYSALSRAHGCRAKCWVLISWSESGTSTYGHSQLKTGHPVRSAIHKQLNGRLVLRWVTTWESLLLYVLFVVRFFFCWSIVMVMESHHILE